MRREKGVRVIYGLPDSARTRVQWIRSIIHSDPFSARAANPSLPLEADLYIVLYNPESVTILMTFPTKADGRVDRRTADSTEAEPALSDIIAA